MNIVGYAPVRVETYRVISGRDIRRGDMIVSKNVLYVVTSVGKDAFDGASLETGEIKIFEKEPHIPYVSNGTMMNTYEYTLVLRAVIKRKDNI